MYQNTKKTVCFCTITENGVVTTIGRSTMLEPHTHFRGGSIPWYDDLKLMKRDKEEASKTKV